ncbi:phage tail tube protein [Halonatronum saccharophilum]|uniref:phage tail tube protein n=1 Tax=Halonatronum saccharophilum TaxID=150060 RepID=UPI0004832E52|nr:phage tail tube protein [Halonatronum saccharophilum]
MAIGENSSTYIGLQTDKDTEAAQLVKLLATSNNLKTNVDSITSDALTGNRFTEDEAVVSEDVGGDISLELTKDTLPYLLLLAGFEEKEEPVVEGEGYRHTFTVAKQLKRWATIIKELADEDYYEVYSGCRINQLSLSVTSKAYITATASILGIKGNEVDGELELGGLSEVMDDRLIALDTTVKLEDIDITGDLNEFSYDHNNNIKADDFPINSRYRRNLRAQSSSSSLQTSTDFNKDEFLVNKARLKDGEYLDLKLNLTDEITFYYPKIKINDIDAPISGPDDITVSLDANVLYDRVEGTPVKVEIISDKEDKY